MRTVVLIAALTLAGGATAAPAAQGDVGKVMQALGMEGLGEQGASALIGMLPALSNLEAGKHQCATRELGRLLERNMQRQIGEALGDDGAVLMQQWQSFLVTPAGKDMAATFRASSPVAAAGTTAPEVSDANKTAIGEFMGTPAFQRFIGGISADGGLPEDIGEQTAKALQSGCGIAIDPNEIS